MKPGRAAACSAEPRAFCGDLRLFAEPHHKPAGPRINRVALRYKTSHAIGTIVFCVARYFTPEAAAAIFCFRNFTPSKAIDSGVGAMSRQMEAAAESSLRAKPKLSIVSHPS